MRHPHLLPHSNISLRHPRAPRGFAPAVARALALTLGIVGLTHLASAQVTAPTLWLDDTTAGSSWSMNLGSVLDLSNGVYTMPQTAPAGWTTTQVQVYNSSGSLQTEQAFTTTKGNGTVVTIYATGSSDPFLSYGFGVSNPTGTVQTYTFTDGSSIAPLSGGYNLFADISGSAVNTSSTGGTASVVPVASFIQTLDLSTNGGATFTDSGADVGPAFTTGTAAGAYSYGVYSSSLTAIAGTPINYWQLADQFTLTGNGDAASFTGFAEILPNNSIVIPEPSTYAALLGALALGLAALRRNKKTVQA